MGRYRASVLRLWPAVQAVARDQTSPQSAVSPDDAVVGVDVSALPVRSRKTWWKRSASAAPPFVKRRPLLSLPSLRAVLGSPPSRHPILPALVALHSGAMNPLWQQRSILAQLP